MSEDLEKTLVFFFERGAPDGVLSAYVYAGPGSEGTPRESDLDVAVLLDPRRYPTRKERAQVRVSLSSDLIHALRDNHVDLVVLNDAPPALSKRIVTSWPRFYCADPEADHAFVRDVQLQAADLELYPTPGAQALFELRPQPYLEGRLRQLARHLEHLRSLQPKVREAADLLDDLSLHNDVRFALLTVVQLVIDIAAELSVRKDLRFSDYSEAIRNLGALEDFPHELVDALAHLPGFRNALLHPHMALEPEQVVEQLHSLEPVEEFLRLASHYATE